jgi:hypothetical protein
VPKSDPSHKLCYLQNLKSFLLYSHSTINKHRRINTHTSPTAPPGAMKTACIFRSLPQLPMLFPSSGTSPSSSTKIVYLQRPTQLLPPLWDMSWSPGRTCLISSADPQQFKDAFSMVYTALYLYYWHTCFPHRPDHSRCIDFSISPTVDNWSLKRSPQTEASVVSIRWGNFSGWACLVQRENIHMYLHIYTYRYDDQILD